MLVCPLSVARFLPSALLPLSGRVPVLKKLAFISTHSRNQQDGVFEEARGAARAWLDVQGDAPYGKRIRVSLHYKQRYSNFSSNSKNDDLAPVPEAQWTWKSMNFVSLCVRDCIYS